MLTDFRQSILNHIPAGKWIKGQDLCRAAGITEPYSNAARRLAKMVAEGVLKTIPLARGSFFALPDAPSAENEMQKRAVLNATATGMGRSLERISKMSDVPAGRVSQILDEWVKAGCVERYIGNYSLKTLFRLVERPSFDLIVESSKVMDTWKELNALFVAMARQTTVRNPYGYMR